MTTNLPWRGAETIDAARVALAAYQSVELHLPAGLHHAVYAHFKSTEPVASAERLDVSGGAELLQRLSEVAGLDAFADLRLPAADAHAVVRLLSPAPTVLITLKTGSTSA